MEQLHRSIRIVISNFFLEKFAFVQQLTLDRISKAYLKIVYI